jgi:CDP-diacylglycerol--glycerol-3-phosphate 3-phosphatidyltransferase
MANLVTLLRVALIFVIIATWARQSQVDWWVLDLLMVPLLGWAIFMDALDGWVARRRQETSDAGALFDIAGDRIVELVLWIFFAIRRDADGTPYVAYWVPLVIVVRTVLTDLVRSVAFRDGRTPFGAKTLQEASWARALTGSRWSRTLYGVLKAVTFCALGVSLAWDRSRVPTTAYEAWRMFTDILVLATVFLAVLRGIPVLWEGRRYLGPDASAGPPDGPVPR